LRELLSSLVRAYGWLGAIKALRNMNSIQRKMLPELAMLNLFEHWPQRTVPDHHVFGENDPLVPASLVRQISSTVTHDDTITSLHNAGHMVHFDEPAEVRSIIAQAHSIA
jgi:pimeloyl-ACP methyl ester carboxylesterase